MLSSTTNKQGGYSCFPRSHTCKLEALQDHNGVLMHFSPGSEL